MPSLKHTSSHYSRPNSHLVIGFMGEVGRALFEIFYKANLEVAGLDRNEEAKSEDSQGVQNKKQFDILHICIPFNKKFIHYVKNYQKEFKPKYTIIHSTVPIGTTSLLGGIHSPIRGIHPNLQEGIKIFPKFLGGPKASKVADAFRKAGIKVILCDKSETTEALKLWDTQQYLESIRLCQRIKQYCDKNSLPFSEVYTLANQTYNEGYTKLGLSEVVRPVLQPIMGTVGGHCLLPNEELLNATKI